MSAKSCDHWPQAYGEKNWTWLKEQDGLARVFRVTFERQDNSDISRFTIELDVKEVLGSPSTSMRTNIWRVLTDGTAGNAASRSWTVVVGEGLIDTDISLEHAAETGLDWLDSFTSQHDMYDHLVSIGRWPAAIPIGIKLGRPEAPAQLRQSLASSLLSGNTKFGPSLRRLAHEHGIDVSAIELEGYKLCAVSRSSEGVGEAASRSEVAAAPIPDAVRSHFVERLLGYGSGYQFERVKGERPAEWFAGSHSYIAVHVEHDAIWFTSRFEISSLSTSLVAAYDLCSNEDLALFDPQTQQWDDVDLTAPELEGYRLSLFSPVKRKAADSEKDVANTQHPHLPEKVKAQLIEWLTNSEYRFKRVSHHGPIEVFSDERGAVTVAVREDQLNIATSSNHKFLAFMIASALASHGTLTVLDLQTRNRFDHELLRDAITTARGSQYPEAIRRMRLAELSGFDVLAADSKHWYDVLLVAPSSHEAFQSGVSFREIEHEEIGESIRAKVVEFLERRNYRRVEGEGSLGRFEHDPGVAVTVSEDRVWFVASNSPALAAEDGPVFEALQTASEITSIVDLAKFDPQPPGVWDDGILPES